MRFRRRRWLWWKIWSVSLEGREHNKKADGSTSAAGRQASDGEAPPSTGATVPQGYHEVKIEDIQKSPGCAPGVAEDIDSLIEQMYNKTEPDHFEPPAPPEEILEADEALIDEAWQEGDLADSLRRKAKSAATKERVVGFSELPETMRADFRAGLAKAAPEVKELLRRDYRSADYVVRQGQKSYYRQISGVVEIGDCAPPSTLAHELFHKLDKGGAISKQFVAALAQDHVALNVVSRGDIKGYLMEKYPQMFESGTASGKERMLECYRGISDILNGLSGGRISYGYGHSRSYWKKAGRLELEAWAQIGRILYENNSEVLGMAFKLFPNLLENTIEALKGLI